MKMLLSALLLFATARPAVAPAAAAADPEAPSFATGLSSAPAREEEVPVVYPSSFTARRGVHLSAWTAGAPRARVQFLDKMKGTPLNMVVVALKEIDGKVYIPGVARAKELGTTRIAIPDPEALLRDLKARGLYAVARISCFKDDTLARNSPEWAVKRSDGSLWLNNNGVAWVDPYRKEIWAYLMEIALKAAALGFDEIQLDYVRFPSDGDTRTCRYSRADHTPLSAMEALREFLAYARERLEGKAKVSVAIFGMTTTSGTDMGIGQRLSTMASEVDAVSPMMYPSHYAHGEYGLKNPNREPYKVINRGLRDAKARLGPDAFKLRPYLQDFSLGFHYGPAQIRAQILAARHQGIESWILWNAGNKYHFDALKNLETR